MLAEQRAFFKEVNAVARSAKPDEALRRLADAIGRGQLDSEGIDKAGRLCSTLWPSSKEKIAARLLVLGQCTTTWLTNALTAVAWGKGSALSVTEGAYDNVIQELLSSGNANQRPDVVVLLPWNQRLLFGGASRSAQERVDAECVFWQQAWSLITERHGARIIQVGYDWMTPGPLGYTLGSKSDGSTALVRAANAALKASLPPGAVFIDLEQVSGDLGRRRFYDPRQYHWTKQPFSEQGVVWLAEHLAASIRALVTGPKKVLVLDLDNTLWGGVVGETGPLGITIGEGAAGEAFSAFQKHVKELSNRGVVLAVSSKNNDADAREPFEKNPNMLLSLDDFAQFEATWDPKAVSLKRIAKTLQLGLDSFVFVDDNPAEREHIRQALPEVAVVDVPEDPAEYVRALDASLYFEAADLTDEDRVRAEQYRSERRRRDAEVSFGSLDDYLTSLGMVAEVRAIDDTNLDRVVQLIGKTNQFNLTTRRHSVAQVRQMLSDPATIGLTVKVTDRFGDYGLISVVIATKDTDGDPKRLVVDTWLMSCRVISRTVEEFIFNALIDAARDRGMSSLVGVYIPTAKNGLVKDLYDRLGFERPANSRDDRIEYLLDLTRAARIKTFVQPNALAVAEA